MTIIWKVVARVIDVAFNQVDVAIGVSVRRFILVRALNEAKCGCGGREQGERPCRGPHIIHLNLYRLDIYSPAIEEVIHKTK